MLDMCYNVMKPDSGRKSFFSAGKPKNLPTFYFLVVAGIILMVYCSSGLFSF